MENTDTIVLDEQKRVENWFDKTYKTRATQYLRPVIAYNIYLTLLETQPEKSLLDIACGIGQMLKAAEAKNVKLSGIDLSGVAVEKAKERFDSHANIQKGNAEALPFDSNSFDYITCLGSLERMLNLNKVLTEMHRVLNDDGKVCVLVRNSERATWKFFKETLGIINKDGHQGAKSLAEWSSIFEENNFEIKRVHHDQWPRNRWFWWTSLSGRLFNYDYDKVLPKIPNIESAYEFIFILKKK